MKLVPEKQRSKSYILRKINNIVKFFESLKYVHSNLENNDIKSPKFKGNTYISNLKSYLNGDFTNDYLNPIISSKKNLYAIKEDQDTILEGAGLDDIDSPFINKKTNEEDIIKQINLRHKYKHSSSRNEYSYINELNELYDSLEHDYNHLLPESKEFTLKKDTNVYSRNMMCLSQNKYGLNNFYHRLLGPTKFNLFDDQNTVKGSDMSIVGFMKKPKQKNNILEVNKNHLLDIVNNTYSKLDLHKNVTLFESEHIYPEIKKDYLVRVVDYTKISNDSTTYLGDIGYIQSIDNDKLVIKPISEPGEDPMAIVDKEFELNDNIMIYNLENGARTISTYNENIYRAYLFGEVDTKLDNKTYKALLQNILPNSNEIIHHIKHGFNNNNLDAFQKELNYYNLKLEDISNSLFTPIKDIIHKNIDDKVTEAIKNQTKFKTFLKKKQSKVLKNFEFIPNNALKSYENVYGPYPYFKNDIDSVDTRLKWLKSLPDFGMLYFKSRVKSIKDQLSVNIEEVIGNLKSSVTILNQRKQKIENAIETEKNKLIAGKNICLENYISKEYNSLSDLKRDNNRIIEVDHDKQRLGESKIVPIDSYAILNLEDGKKQVYKRIEIPTADHMWNLEGGINIDNIITANKEFCDTQFKNINELEAEIKEAESCKFSDKEKSCVSKYLEQHIHDLNVINKQIEDKQSYINQSDDLIQFNTNLDKELTYYNDYLNLINDQKKRVYETDKKDAEEAKKEDIDPKYESLYLKIDLYLEKISSLNDTQKYELLDDIIKKYGRNANTRNGENAKNIYCKYGNKVICCAHNINLINMFKSNKNYDTLLQETIDTYGIKNEGKYWCNNCGKVLFMGEYETAESFKKNGARDITHELVEEDSDDENDTDNQNSDLVASLKQHLLKDNTHLSNTNIIDIYKIINVLLSIMGIKLNSRDELQVIKDSEGLVNTHIKTKQIWSQTYRGKPKSIDKNYELYANINTIIYTVSNLFIMLQTSIPHYTINKPHSKCKTSLEGYPLDEKETNNNGIKYFACMLVQLRNTDSLWKCLKKMKLEVLLLDIIKKLYNNDLIKYKYNLKRTYIRKTIKTQDIKVLNNWNKFSPPLNLFEIDNPSLNSVSLTKKPKNVNELANYYSLKYISGIDKLINRSQIENNMFSPALLSQSCCLTQLNETYDNLIDFYKQNTMLEKYINNNVILEEYQQDIKSINISINKQEDESLESFSKLLLPLEEELNQEILTTLFEHYVSSGEFTGTKRIYDNDICIFTGEHVNAIRQTIYNNEEYYTLLKEIYNKKRVENKILNDNLNIITSLEEVVDINPILKENNYINKFIVYLKTHNTKSDINKGWSDFNIQLQVEKDELIDLFGKFDPSKKNEVKKILTNLGNLEEIYKENLKLYEKQKADSLFNEQKLSLLYKYIYSYLFTTIYKIKNNKANEENSSLPQNWKIEHTYVDIVNKIALSDNDLVNKYISKKTLASNNNYYHLSKIIKYSSKNLKHIFSEEHVYNCSTIEKFSKLTHENLCSLIELIFIIILKHMLINNTNTKGKRKKSQTFEEDEAMDASSIKIVTSSDISNEEVGGEGNDSNDIEEIVSSQEVNASSKEIYNLIYDILVKINSYTINNDKFTQYNINEAIEKKSDEEKEDNLKFIEALNKESRQSLKTMISLGIDKWKDLSKKTNKQLYFEEVEELSNTTEDLSLSVEEIDDENRNLAIAQLGENHTQEQYTEWLENRNTNMQEDSMVQQEAEYLADDDGDEQGDEDYDGEL